MASTSKVILDEHSSDFVARQVASGKYQATSDVVRKGLELLEDEEAKLQALRAALIEGEQSGPGEIWDYEKFLAEMRADPNCP